MTRAFAFSLFAGLLGATLGACADPDTLPGADAAPEDAGMLDAEPPTDLWAEGSLRLTVDPEGVQATLWWGDHAALTPWTVGFEAAGDRWTTADWPERTWTTGPDWAEGRYTGAPTLPVLVWRITREADAVRSVVRLEAAGRRAVVDRLITLSANVASPRALGAQGWLPVAEAPPRRGFQRLQGGAVSLAIHSPGTWISVASGLEISPRSPTTLLGPGDSLSAPAVTVRLDGLWAAWPGAEVPVPAFGWRSGAWGSALSGSLVRRQGQALAAQGLASDGSLLLLEGLWYAGPGDWRPGLVFPGGFEGIRAAVAPARLALRWPALHAAPDAPLPSGRPEARLPDDPGRCAAPGCTRLDPALPVVRAAVARSASAFVGDAAVALSDLPDAEVVGLGVRATLAAEIGAAAPSLTLLGERDEDTPPWPGFAADDPCRAAADTHPWPAQCTGHLTGASERPPPATDGLSAERALAWALVAAGPRMVDPGPLRLMDRSEGAQRIALTMAALSGGPRLLGDDLTGAALPATVATLRALPGRRAQPLDAGDGADPPNEWAAPGWWAAVNWGSVARPIAVPAGPWRFTWRSGEVPATVTLAPGDALLLQREDAAAVVGGGHNQVENEP